MKNSPLNALLSMIIKKHLLNEITAEKNIVRFQKEIKLISSIK